MAFKHGTYADQIPYAGKLAATAVGTIPAYIGTAPIQQINTLGAAGFNYAPYINKPILIESMPQAQAKLGYSADWASYTLGEAIMAHFGNGVAPIGPIVVVNMANPADKESTDTTATVTLSGATADKVGYIADAKAAIENIVVTATPSITASDYTLTYEGDSIKIHITKAAFAASTCTATYKKIDTSNTAITTTDFETALSALDLCESSVGVIPNLVVAPGYSKDAAYHAKMIAKVTGKISGKWGFITLSDVPAATVTTIALAIAWKSTNGYTSKYDKPCFPRVLFGGVKYHLSTMTAVDMQAQDTASSGVPYISPSNKTIFAASAILDDGTPLYIDEPTANTANAKGLTTVNIIRGALRLWGGVMANYDSDAIDNINPEDRSDASIRMMVYLCNTLQYDYIDSIDGPMSKRDIDSIKVSVQQWLNSLVNEGKLLYATVDFVDSANSTSAMADGDFVFNVSTTTTPNAKSITFKVQYTTTGLTTLTGGVQ